MGRICVSRNLHERRLLQNGFLHDCAFGVGAFCIEGASRFHASTWMAPNALAPLSQQRQLPPWQNKDNCVNSAIALGAPLMRGVESGRAIFTQNTDVEGAFE
ncbi:hypothetical protein PIB30_022374 [Stylosanthes scabra]|uniref:Uncharacterized protein n=1 Tax=Stylosanthes scabra TaxID=79078 RepID=A0ABU6XAQ9_9FABA|nr:hypothetical protein [Stylosanthes scabra]